MTTNLSQILDSQCIVLDLKGRRKRAVVEELVGWLEAAGIARNGPSLVDEIMQREKLSSTVIGHGIAVPHKLSSSVDRTAMAFGRAPNGLKFDSQDSVPVTLVFLLVGPAGAHGEHLRLLSKLSRYLHDRSFRDALLSAGSAEEIGRIFTEWEAGE